MIRTLLNTSPIIVQVFEEASWMEFIRCLEGFDEEIVKEFNLSCKEESEISIIRGLDISFSLDTISVATRLL